MAFMGMDVVAIRGMSAQFRSQAQEIDQISRELRSALAATEWVGADAQAFESSWESVHAPGIARASSVISRAADLAHRQANEQERASRS
jgi:uncharacterized protein YukE